MIIVFTHAFILWIFVAVVRSLLCKATMFSFLHFLLSLQHCKFFKWWYNLTITRWEFKHRNASMCCVWCLFMFLTNVFCTLQILYKLQLSLCIRSAARSSKAHSYAWNPPPPFPTRVLLISVFSSIPNSTAELILTHHLTFCTPKVATILPNERTVIIVRAQRCKMWKYVRHRRVEISMLCYSVPLLMWFNKHDVMERNSVHTVHKWYGLCCSMVHCGCTLLAMLPQRK